MAVAFCPARCIKTIGQEYLAPELSRTNIGERNHTGTLIRAAKKWDHQIVSLVAVEIHGLRELQCGVQGKQCLRRLKAAIAILTRR